MQNIWNHCPFLSRAKAKPVKIISEEAHLRLTGDPIIIEVKP
jgi:hypothetical protein